MTLFRQNRLKSRDRRRRISVVPLALHLSVRLHALPRGQPAHRSRRRCRFLPQPLAHFAPQAHIVPPPTGIALAAHTAPAPAACRPLLALHDAGARRGLQHPFGFVAVLWVRADDRRMQIVHGRIAGDVVRATAARGLGRAVPVHPPQELILALISPSVPPLTASSVPGFGIPLLILDDCVRTARPRHSTTSRAPGRQASTAFRLRLVSVPIPFFLGRAWSQQHFLPPVDVRAEG